MIIDAAEALASVKTLSVDVSVTKVMEDSSSPGFIERFVREEAARKLADELVRVAGWEQTPGMYENTYRISVNVIPNLALLMLHRAFLKREEHKGKGQNNACR